VIVFSRQADVRQKVAALENEGELDKLSSSGKTGRRSDVVAKRIVITGATGLLGSHLAEQLAARGDRVRALVRPGSDTAFLRQVGVELIEGDLSRPETLPRAVEGADLVFHSAAGVGDWGPWRYFQESVIETTANLTAACLKAGVGRLLHVSSIAVYGHPYIPPGQLFNEDAPLGQNVWMWDHYCRAKIAAEERVRAYPGAWTIVRPSWIYGPRDRNSFPRVLKTLKAGRVSVIGSGRNLLNIVYAGDVAEGAIRAAEHPGSVGRAYNLSSEGEISQREFLDALTDALGRRRVRFHVPYRLAFYGGLFSEVVGKAIALRRPPYLTRYVVALIGRPTLFSTERARNELGWERKVHPLEGLRQTMEWFRQQSAGVNGAGGGSRVEATAKT
jgi:nucleoside-diphosphate-sugar epimerase